MTATKGTLPAHIVGAPTMGDMQKEMHAYFNTAHMQAHLGLYHYRDVCDSLIADA